MRAVGYGENTLPAGIRSRFVADVNGLNLHILEAGFESENRPCLLLLHGFPELAYSWRKVMLPLAEAGFHVIAPDQRGYGLTTGWDGAYDGDVGCFRLFNIVRDALGLVYSLGYRQVEAVIGHDFGSPVAAYCALLRPDVFRSVVMMSAPVAGPTPLPFNTANGGSAAPPAPTFLQELAALARPRKHYQWYYSEREANADMRDCRQGIHDFLRAYYHYKSADWVQNKPFRLTSWSAEELAKMPTYYIMDRDQGMAASVAPQMPTTEQIAACQWLTEPELAVYSRIYKKTGFQGGLQWYRCMTDSRLSAELQLFAGRHIDVPSCFIAGKSDWGVYQKPGDFEAMQHRFCTQMRDCHLLDGAGHWVQQEQPEAVSDLLLRFVSTNHSR